VILSNCGITNYMYSAVIKIS